MEELKVGDRVVFSNVGPQAQMAGLEIGDEASIVFINECDGNIFDMLVETDKELKDDYGHDFGIWTDGDILTSPGHGWWVIPDDVIRKGDGK